MQLDNILKRSVSDEDLADISANTKKALDIKETNEKTEPPCGSLLIIIIRLIIMLHLPMFHPFL